MARGRKTGGRDFKPGEHGGPRGPDRIPRGSVRAIYQYLLNNPDDLAMLYQSAQKAARNPRLAIYLLEHMGDRLEGKPKQAHDVNISRRTIFKEAPTVPPPMTP